jgi:hypothetical protein
MSSTPTSARPTATLTDPEINFCWRKIKGERSSIDALEADSSGSRFNAAYPHDVACTMRFHQRPCHHTSFPPPSHASPAASSDEQLLIADEVAQHKSKINSLELQLFSSALSQIEAEVTSPEFTAAFAAAASGTGIESFRTMNDMPLDAQVPSAASFNDVASLLIPPSF